MILSETESPSTITRSRMHFTVYCEIHFDDKARKTRPSTVLSHCVSYQLIYFFTFEVYRLIQQEGQHTAQHLLLQYLSRIQGYLIDNNVYWMYKIPYLPRNVLLSRKSVSLTDSDNSIVRIFTTNKTYLKMLDIFEYLAAYFDYWIE